MHIAVATANYFMLPFEQALEIIAGAGFEFVELDLFWERKTWAMAQHLRGYSPREAVRQIHRAGLKVASIHDGGGVLHGPGTLDGLINPQVDAYLDLLGYAPAALVFHTPHLEGEWGDDWWRPFSEQVGAALGRYRPACQVVTVENMPFFDGYTVPLPTPARLLEFSRQTGIGITLDTTHYAQIGVDILAAARLLAPRVNTVHLSDYRAPKTHVFIGDGELDLPACLRTLDPSALVTITLECSPVRHAETVTDRSSLDLIERLKIAKTRLEGWR